MRAAAVPESGLTGGATFLGLPAAVLELPPDRLPPPADGEDPARGWTAPRWLGGPVLGLARVADPVRFSWAGPWIARVCSPSADRRSIVMYGIRSAVAWDPSRGGPVEKRRIEDGLLLAAPGISLALPPRPGPPAAGTVEEIWIAPAAAAPARSCQAAHAVADRGLDGDRALTGTGTFPSGLPGSLLTQISAEVCESFGPPLAPAEHRRSLVTRGIELNRLVDRQFMIGKVRCRGMRLCEPCMASRRRASRPLLRQLIHRARLPAEILSAGLIRAGDRITVAEPAREDR